MSHAVSQRFALLIDAENASPSCIKDTVAILEEMGSVIVRRAYGDWTTAWLTGWKDVLHQHAIQPIQQFSCASGKNSTDASLIIDAMDLLHQGRFDGYCIVSSDSDFTRLATRLRESGARVVGVGESKTPRAFIAACDRFIAAEGLRLSHPPEALSQEPSRKKVKFPKIGKKALRSDKRLLAAINSAIEASASVDGWADLAQVASRLSKLIPDFDSRKYGYKNISKLLKHTELFKIESRKTIAGHSFYVVKKSDCRGKKRRHTREEILTERRGEVA